ncbi:hypothetical protein Q3G72_021635 [Acer saccharum]|nr:hypothetical protein Q3G72_021635 [Acer saccharum]
MDVVISLLGSVAIEACCLFSFSIGRDRKALKEETEALVELRDKAKVKEWLGEVEKFLVEVKSLETSIKGYERRQNQSRCSLHCSQRCKFSKEVGMLLKDVRRLTFAGSFSTGMVDHGPSAPPSIEDQATA